MSDNTNGSDPLPDHEQQAWEDIVAHLGGSLGGPAEPAVARQEFDPLAEHDDDGYQPPEPPPLPRPSEPWTKAAWVAVAAGPALILVANVFGWDRIMSVMGMVITAGGFVGLISRMKDREDNGDDGAVV
ncbi:MAG: hypothetical protein WCG77_05410 [Actinomycetes bacterium]|jgi:hypothetical protein